ncbi:hypothetical protein [Miltoncostaea marina]|uniref:hypothetical protein n=1 Tax=Miltoncostaea marina TaxID=2843215 RepID=UPI001C3D67B0|nr:hypothetical protein [Miltoncostaea marina]
MPRQLTDLEQHDLILHAGILFEALRGNGIRTDHPAFGRLVAQALADCVLVGRVSGIRAGIVDAQEQLERLGVEGVVLELPDEARALEHGSTSPQP